MSEEAVTEEAATEEASQQEEQSSERPEWLPEKFNTPEDMAKSYTSLSTKLGEKEEEVRERLMSELSEQASEGVPASVGDYELPDYLNEEEAIESDTLKAWADHCFENGYTHDEFKKGIDMYMSAFPDDAVEAIMEALKDSSVSDQTNISSNFNEIELQEMQKDERYWNPAKRDNNFVNQVNDGYKKLYG